MESEKKLLGLVEKVFSDYLYLTMNEASFKLNASISKIHLGKLLVPLIMNLAKQANVDPLKILDDIDSRKPYRIQQKTM